MDMRRAKRALAGLNALVAASLIAFGWRYLVAPPKVDRLGDLDRSAATPSPPPPTQHAPEDAFALPNPLRKPGALPSPRFEAVLIGALPTSAPENGVAFLRSAART